MISEGSCDTEDCWKFSFDMTGKNYILYCIKIENGYCNNISQYYCFYCIFEQINAALTVIRDLSQNHNHKKKNLQTQNYSVCV